MKKNEFTFYLPNTQIKESFPFASSSISAGFASPIEDSIEDKLDLNQYLIKHPSATFFVRVDGDSMKNASILQGDILIVDRSLTAKSSNIVIAIVEGEFTVKRLKIDQDCMYLMPENSSYSPIKITPETDFQIWGVVTTVIHRCLS